MDLVVNAKGDFDYIYFVLFDCNKTLLMPALRNNKIKFILEFKNQGSHLEAGDEGLIKAYTVFALFFFAIFAYLLRSFIAELRHGDKSEVNYAYIIVNICLSLKMVGIIMDIVDLWILSSQGMGFTFLNFMSQIFNHISQYLLSLLLIFLAHGWTIHVKNLEDFELFVPISVLIGIFKVIIIGLGKMEDNSALFFHRYDSFIGWILAAFNVGLFVYFIDGAITSFRKIRQQRKTFNFYVSLTVFGSIYFFLFPILMLVSIAIPPEHRTFIIETGRIASQFVALAYMAYITGNKKGVYKDLVIFEVELPTRIE